MGVLKDISKSFDIIEFLLKNPEEWFTIRHLNRYFGDVHRLYSSTEKLYKYGFIYRERRKGYGKPIWIKLNRESKQTELITALYISLNQKVHIT